MTELEKAVKLIIDNCNSMNPKEDLRQILLYEMIKNHRTIQQLFMKQINNFLVEYSETSFDLRNEASVKFAKDVKEIEAYFPYV